MAKWDNMLSILWMLRSGKKLTAAQIAEELEISVRTVYRYVDALCASGVPLVADSGHDGGFRLLDRFQETPLFFQTVELKAIVDASKFAKGAGYPFTEELAKALDKIENSLNEQQIHDLQRHTSGFDVIAGAIQPSTIPLLRQVEQAIVERRTVRIAYRKEQAVNAMERHIDPYGLAYRRNEWYVVAVCHRTMELRTFRADRIERLVPTESLFEKPENFSVNDYFREQSNREREAEGPMTVLRIEGEAERLNAICGHWHLQHYLTERTDREARFLIDAPTMYKYVPVYLLTFGTNIRIQEPEFVRQKVKELAEQIARHYEDDPI